MPSEGGRSIINPPFLIYRHLGFLSSALKQILQNLCGEKTKNQKKQQLANKVAAQSEFIYALSPRGLDCDLISPTEVSYCSRPLLDLWPWRQQGPFYHHPAWKDERKESELARKDGWQKGAVSTTRPRRMNQGESPGRFQVSGVKVFSQREVCGTFSYFHLVSRRSARFLFFVLISKSFR